MTHLSQLLTKSFFTVQKSAGQINGSCRVPKARWDGLDFMISLISPSGNRHSTATPNPSSYTFPAMRSLFLAIALLGCSASAQTNTAAKIEEAFGVKLGEKLDRKLLVTAETNAAYVLIHFSPVNPFPDIPLKDYKAFSTVSDQRIHQISINTTLGSKGQMTEMAGKILASLKSKYGNPTKSDIFDGFGSAEWRQGKREIYLSWTDTISFDLFLTYLDDEMRDQAKAEQKRAEANSGL